MANPEFTVDDEITQSLRTIEKQRSTKRVVVLGGMVVALVALMLAVLLGYSDTLEGNAPAQTTVQGR